MPAHHYTVMVLFHADFGRKNFELLNSPHYKPTKSVFTERGNHEKNYTNVHIKSQTN